MNATIYVDDKQFWRSVKKYAKKHRMSISKLIKIALLEYFAGEIANKILESEGYEPIPKGNWE